MAAMGRVSTVLSAAALRDTRPYGSWGLTGDSTASVAFRVASGCTSGYPGRQSPPRDGSPQLPRGFDLGHSGAFPRALPQGAGATSLAS